MSCLKIRKLVVDEKIFRDFKAAMERTGCCCDYFNKVLMKAVEKRGLKLLG